MRLAVAQTILRANPGDRAEIAESGRGVRALMREAHAAGARLAHFPEGATCWPDKHVMSSTDGVGPADWSRADWEALRHELAEIAALAGKLRLWTVVGAVHRLTPPHRPYNSLYVISDRGEVVTRYDERLLSNTKVSFMYSPGSQPVTFEVDGMRFGLAAGMEVHFPEIFGEYERLDVDAVLFSTAGPPTDETTDVFAAEALAHAAINSYWVGYAGPVGSGLICPDGEWRARCQSNDPAVAVADLLTTEENLARPWRRKVRAGIYEPHLVSDDPRSDDRRAI
ncbi:carbon-nitrogen hydrolase family protein [Fodinicola acaciae]|uniref:carbon-nitrogen hydrolase family protein n=1 Tax=Fodinicola acaciae TaxID=2681555 RepID=UPI001C9E9145|nr:carbon-nitrogen hydrolase family protein [Fodinicola acaciae]